MAASLKLHESRSYGGVLVSHIHQLGLPLDGGELEEHFLVQLDPPLQDANEHLQGGTGDGGLYRSQQGLVLYQALLNLEEEMM